ncbi:MAG: hypothetical protein AB7D06_10965 [Pedobacter sp.]
MLRGAAGILIGLLLILCFAGCSDTVSRDLGDYVGEWTSPNMHLLITPDGSVKYRRIKQGGRVSLTGTLKGFKGHDFIVRYWLFSTTFEVSVPPHEENGEWHMVVDGVDLVRSRRPQQPFPQDGSPKSLQVRFNNQVMRQA